ncbi:MAG: bifunctional folylpolyglutamate synthase/dihydrofolate synthase [Planctomycetia bacterium]
MNHSDALRYLDSRIDFERRDIPTARDLRLDRIRLLLDRFDSPHRNYQVVHVAGTKGKGSTAVMTARLLQAGGFKVGLHTSPHFERIEERFVVDGEVAEASEFLVGLEELMPAVAEVDGLLAPRQTPLTYFEITTALAFLHFARRGVDWAVVEVGLGGRLDATNVVDPAVCAVTSISRDHMQLLGDSLPLIAAEKAGIIKPGRPVVSGVTADAARDVVRDAARERGAPLYEIGVDFTVDYRSRGLAGGEVAVTTWRQRWPTFLLPAVGAHQANNAALALAMIDALRDAGRPLEKVAVDALRDVVVPGRLEVLSENPTVVLDVAHNDASTTALVEALRSAEKPGRKGPRI